MRSLGTLFVSALLGSAALAFEPVAILTGKPKIVDGDGLGFGRIEVRLQGIAAPEVRGSHAHPEGRASSEHLLKLIGDRYVRCELDGTLAGKRPVGVCYIDGVDLGMLMVRDGHARDCPRYSGGRYQDVEATATRRLGDTYPLPPYC